MSSGKEPIREAGNAEVIGTRFRTLMSRLPTGVAVVATTGEGEPHGMTANAITSVSLEPPLLLFCVHRKARMAEYVNRSGVFSVNILTSDQEPLSRLFSGQETGATNVPWAEFEGCPALDCLASFHCRVQDIYPGGDHWIVVGEVLSMAGRDGNDPPLAYYRGRYTSVDGLREGETR